MNLSNKLKDFFTYEKSAIDYALESVFFSLLKILGIILGSSFIRLLVALAWGKTIASFAVVIYCFLALYLAIYGFKR